MRLGQLAPEMVDIPSLDGVRCAQVPLTEAEAQRGIIAAANLDVQDNTAGMNARGRIAMHSDVWLSLREPDELGNLVFESIDAMAEALSPGDVDYLIDNLTTIMDYASPAIDGLSDKDLAELKKDFAAADWSALTGRQWAAVKLCCRVLLPELLLGKLRGSTSTDSSTTTSASDEST